MEIKIEKITLKKGSERCVLDYLKEDEEDFREIEERVEEILSRVKREGDRAIYYYLKKFDKIDKLPPYPLKVSEEEMDDAYKKVERDVIASLEIMIDRVREFHKHQIKETWSVFDEEGSIYGTIIRPLKRVGIYVPGGRAAYPSTVVMGVVPALLAGVKEVAITTPPSNDFSVSPYVLVASKLLGIKEIYKMGGAYAIGALAYGTETITPVDKIVGPGNVYVTIAKKLVWGNVDIDSLAGPSEVVVIGEEGIDPEGIALDLMSQAEHDPYARSIFITPSKVLIEKVKKAIENIIDTQPRKEIILSSLSNRGMFIEVEDIESAIEVSNYIAPEHLQIALFDPFPYLSHVKNAGAVFLGPYASVPLGDYIAGTNHILPTGRSARFLSSLDVDTFYKRISFFYSNKELAEELGKKATPLASCEGLFAHKSRLNFRGDLK